MRAKTVFCFALFFFFFSHFLSKTAYARRLIGEREKMIIVSSSLFVPQLSRYMEAKASDNIDCRIILVDSSDDFNCIKSRIDELYTDFTADFLLLVGDFQHIPAFIIEEGLSDMYYTFENENTSIPRMIVGRFSVETEQDLQTIMDRNLERKPRSGHVIGIASEEKSELTQKKDYEQIRRMGRLLQLKGFSFVSELFDGSQSELDEDGNPRPSDVISALQTGATWLNYAGYGSYDGWMTSGFENKHIDSLRDDVELPVIVSASCLGGHFAYRDCFAEKWLRATKNGNPLGAVALIMSSSLADWDATLSAMLVMTELMPSLDSNCRLGHLYLQGYNHIVYNMQRPKDAYCWILFGDPSLWVYPVWDNAIKEKESFVLLPVVYPNPATSLVHIRDGGLVRLYDIEGKLILEKLFPHANNTLDITPFVSGIYFLSLQTTHKMFRQKLIIKK